VSGLTSVLGRLPGDPIVSEGGTSTGDRDLRRASARASEFTALPLLVLSPSAGSPAGGHILHGRNPQRLKPYPDGSVSRSYWCKPHSRRCGKTEVDQAGHWIQRHAALVCEILSDTRNTDEIEHAAYEAASESRPTRTSRSLKAEAVAEALHRSPRDEARSPSPATTLVIKPVDETHS